MNKDIRLADCDALPPILECKETNAPQDTTIKQLEEHLKKHGGHIEGTGKGIKWESD